MSTKKILSLMAFVFLLSALVACATSPTPGLPANVPAVSRASIQPTATKIATIPTVAATATTKTTTNPAATTVVANRKTHDDAKDYAWNPAQAVRITLQGNSITASGSGATIAGNKATITAPGTYSISGSLTDGQIIVDTTSNGLVQLVLNGAEIRSSTCAPIYVVNAEKTVIILPDNTRNSIVDAKTYQLAASEDEPNAAIFSKGDLSIFGNGSLTVEGNFNDGIASKDGLVIASGTLSIKSVDDGIRGKDYLVVRNGAITISAQGDGLKSDDAEDAAKGFISIDNGTFNITVGGDAIEAQTDMTIANGKFTLKTGGGSSSRIATDASAKGIKAATNVKIDGGNFSIDSADDALNSNNSIVINGGIFGIATGDDGMHAELNLQINAGTLNITKSYEGLESENITINGGEIHIVSSDDGLNGAGGGTASGATQGPGGAPPGRGGFPPAGNYRLSIHGGYIVIESGGDGMDINGSIEMTNGTVIVNGPIVRMNSAVDYDRTFKMTGGFLIAVGSSGMAQAPDDSSTQYALLLNLNTTQRAGTLIHIQGADGKAIVTFSPTKEYQSIAFSSPALVKGATYEVYFGGSSTGTIKDHLYQGGTYSGGTKNTSFTTSSIVTRIGVTRFR